MTGNEFSNSKNKMEARMKKKIFKITAAVAVITFGIWSLYPSTPSGMVWIPGGEFMMGSNSNLAKNNEKPAHKVKVDGFWMDKTDVTNAQFTKFVKATGYVTTA